MKASKFWLLVLVMVIIAAAILSALVPDVAQAIVKRCAVGYQKVYDVNVWSGCNKHEKDGSVNVRCFVGFHREGNSCARNRR